MKTTKENIERQRRREEKRAVQIGVAAFIIDEQENILLLHRNKSPQPGTWTLPSGGVNPGEDFENALRREVREETGLEIEPKGLLAITRPVDDETGLSWFSPVFRVQVISGEPQNVETDIHLALQWFSLKNLPEKMNVTTTVAIQSYLEFKAKTQR